MSNIAIRVENLGKKYIIAHQQPAQYTALRDVLANRVRAIGRKLIAPKLKFHQPPTREEFWALKEISFTVRQGERIGIIGHNGAGKSTLLKLLSRITIPTTGRIAIKGRVASLLEVGTGFHPELTGRENIYLNGAILGMGRAEIQRKFDEIVAFAEVEQFLDTPVKRYSSGMYVRLAFAVAAHLEPEILLIDEVLAVGDAQFQKKCLGKLQNVSEDGRTVIFVSHSMPTIASLCERCILLSAGQIVKVGTAAEAILHYYTNGISSPANVDFHKLGKTIGDNHAILLSGQVKNSRDECTSDIDINDAFKISMRYKIIKQTQLKFVQNFHFYTAGGVFAFITSHTTEGNLEIGDYVSECYVPANFLNDRTYFVDLALSSFDEGIQVHFWERSALSFNIRDPIEGSLTRNGFTGPMPGVIRPCLQWEVSKVRI